MVIVKRLIGILLLVPAIPCFGGDPVIQGDVTLVQLTTEPTLQSNGFAQIVCKDTGLVLESLNIQGEHRIRHIETGVKLAAVSFKDVSVYGGAVKSQNFVVGECYRSSVIASRPLTTAASEFLSLKVCAQPTETDTGGTTGDDPLNQDNTCTCTAEEGSFCACSPILVDLEGDGFRLTGLDDPVQFDIDATGEPRTISWTHASADDAFLVLDRNGNGRIDDGSELFGSSTAQPSSADPNGFRALAVFDQPEHGGDGDGVMTAADGVFGQLGLWTDFNHDESLSPGS